MTATPTPDVHVETTLQLLLDERAVTQVLHRYATALDERDWALLRTCFVPDAVAAYDGMEECVGVDAVEQLCRRALSPLDRSHHLLGNVTVLVEGDEATSQCYLHAQHVRASATGGPRYVVAGRYRDRLVRTVDGWRIAHRRLETWWTDGNPSVVTG